MSKYYDFVYEKEMDEYIKMHVSHIKGSFLRASIDECEKLKDFIGSPKCILDLGCGLGRSSVFLNKHLKLDAFFYLADFNMVASINWPLEYFDDVKPVPFSNLELTRRFCINNGLKHFEIIDLSKKFSLKRASVDLVYSFNAVGYHWSIKKAVERYRLTEVTTDAVFIFGVRNILRTVKQNFEKFLKDNIPFEDLRGRLLKTIDTYDKEKTKKEMYDTGLDFVKKIRGDYNEDYCIYNKGK